MNPVDELILSHPQWKPHSLSDWLAGRMGLLESLRSKGVRPGLETRVMGGGDAGNFDQNVGIEQADILVIAAESWQLPVVSMRLPLELGADEALLGKEIARVDGWVDVASYLGARLIRLLPQATPQADLEWKALNTMISYGLDMGMQVTVPATLAADSRLAGLLNGLDAEGERLGVEQPVRQPPTEEMPGRCLACVYSADGADPQEAAEQLMAPPAGESASPRVILESV